MKLSRQKIFLVDGLGALLSGLMIGLVLPYLNTGLPPEILSSLALTAFIFSSYSLSGFIFQKGRLWLGTVVIANLLYCVATFSILVWFYDLLGHLTTVYFAAEIGILLGLVMIEVKVLREFPD